jgi:hypothetical protein
MKKTKEYYESLDRRTKEYKKYKAKFEKEQASKSKGLGDTIAKVTKATGIEKIVKAVAGDDCGCDDRKDTLNKLFSYKVVNCLIESDYNYLSNWFSEQRTKVTRVEQRALLDIYNRTFNTKKFMSSCSKCIKDMISKLEKVFNEFN